MSQHTATALLRKLQEEEGQKKNEAFNELVALVYDELHGIAKEQRRRWQGNRTLNTTGLVHAAYEKLIDQEQKEWKSRAHFMAVAATAMRHILINYARDQRAQKRGGDQPKISLEQLRDALGREVAFNEQRSDVLVALGDALGQLEQVSERQSRIVECRFFGGMTIEETATALGISTATVSRGWNMARTWLYREMQRYIEE